MTDDADHASNDVDAFDRKHDRIRRQRYRQIREWAEYVRTHPDEDWGEQVNRLVNAQLDAARRVGDERPDVDRLRDSTLFDG